MPTKELRKLLEKTRNIKLEIEKYCSFDELNNDFVNNHNNRQIICKLLMEFNEHVNNIEEVVSAASGGGTTSFKGISDVDHQFYNKYIKPNKNKFWAYPNPDHIFDHLFDDFTQEPDYFLHDEPLDSGRVDTPSILSNTIKKSLEYCSDDDNDDGGAEGFHEYFNEVSVDFESAKKLVNYPFFRLDEWRSNIEEIRPIFLKKITKKEDDFPPDLNRRLKALRDSYIFGNWIGVLALCRAVLEFALRDKIPESKSVDLKDLIEETDISKPLRDKMHCIRKGGNWILHPNWTSHQNKGCDFLEFPPRKSSAQKSMKDLILILEELYRAK